MVELGVIVSVFVRIAVRDVTRTRKEPALASQLKNLHDFEEDLKEGLDIISLYNQSLGTRADQHMYDRVEDRDHGEPVRPWEKTPTA